VTVINRSGRISVEGVALGETLEQIVTRRGAPSSQCWVADDKITRLVFCELALHFSETGDLISVRNGNSLEMDGVIFIAENDDEEVVQTKLGAPTRIEGDGFGPDNTWPMRVWTYELDAEIVTIVTTGRKVSFIELDRPN
jgi:hypothetical protein